MIKGMMTVFAVNLQDKKEILRAVSNFVKEGKQNQDFKQ